MRNIGQANRAYKVKGPIFKNENISDAKWPKIAITSACKYWPGHTRQKYGIPNYGLNSFNALS